MHMIEEEDYLAHFGVLGMRWGIRKERSTGHTKASRKYKKEVREDMERHRKDQLSNLQQSRDAIRGRIDRGDFNLTNSEKSEYEKLKEKHKKLTPEKYLKNYAKAYDNAVKLFSKKTTKADVNKQIASQSLLELNGINGTFRAMASIGNKKASIVYAVEPDEE